MEHPLHQEIVVITIALIPIDTTETVIVMNVHVLTTEDNAAVAAAESEDDSIHVRMIAATLPVCPIVIVIVIVTTIVIVTATVAVTVTVTEIAFPIAEGTEIVTVTVTVIVIEIEIVIVIVTVIVNTTPTDQHSPCLATTRVMMKNTAAVDANGHTLHHATNTKRNHDMTLANVIVHLRMKQRKFQKHAVPFQGLVTFVNYAMARTTGCKIAHCLFRKTLLHLK
jgi:hypothetical protein